MYPTQQAFMCSGLISQAELLPILRVDLISLIVRYFSLTLACIPNPMMSQAEVSRNWLKCHFDT
jgi:hypothetical protein